MEEEGGVGVMVTGELQDATYTLPYEKPCAPWTGVLRRLSGARPSWGHHQSLVAPGGGCTNNDP